MFILTNSVFAQSGEKYSVGLNTLKETDGLGSYNAAGLNFYTNNIKRGSVTKEGLLDYSFSVQFRKDLKVDSILTVWQVIVDNAMNVTGNVTVSGILQAGQITISGSNVSSGTGTITFGNNDLNTTGTINATDIQTQTINTGELLINGQPLQIDDTLNVNVINAGNIVIDGPATQIYSTNGVIDFNNNDIKNVGKLTVSQLGINTPNPIASMQVSGTDELNTTIGLIRYSDDDRSSRLSFVKYRGTMANPKSVLSGDRLGIISYHGFDGVQFQSSDMIKGVATENFIPTGRGSKIEFSTTPNGSTTDHLALILDNDQTARFANTVYAPNIVISDKIITKEAEFDSLRINEKLYATGSLTTDTVHAIKQISVNNTLQVEKQDTTDYAEIFTKDESSLYIQSKEGTATEKNTIINAYTGKMGIGTTDPSGSEKLTVVGNTRLQGDVVIGGTITAQQMNVDSTTFNELVVTKKIRIGSNSLILESDPVYGIENSIYTDDYPTSTGSKSLFIQSAGFSNNTIINSNNSGNVGIGISNPHDKLDVAGNIRLNNYDILLRTSDVNGNHGLGWYGDANGVDKKYADVSVNGPVLYGYDGGALGTRQGFPPSIPYADTIALVWKSNGNVGIGTENPQKKLHIKDFTDNSEIDDDPEDPIDYTGSLRLEHALASGQTSIWDIEPVVFGIAGVPAKLRIGTPDNPVMTLLSNGNVGIGIDLKTIPNNNPNNYKLAVNGVIGAKDVVIEISQTPWPDYVFDYNYKLMPINDLNNFVKLNKHLPDIPSADCVNENGLSVGEINAQLLKKVEEMTLYIIELNKQNEELSRRISLLENNSK